MDIGVGEVLRRCGRKHVVKFLLRRFYKADEIRPVHIQTLRHTADRAAASHPGSASELPDIHSALLVLLSHVYFFTLH